LLGSAAAVAVALLWPRTPAAAEAAPARAAAADFDHGWRSSMDRDATWSGVAGCTSSSCHAVTASAGAKRGEYGTWADADKHARAFQVLYNDRSQRIVRNLDPEHWKPATETALCLKCHASHDGVLEGTEEGFSLADGIGCESCHGASGRWLTEHYRAGFKGLSLEGKAALGMRPTKDLAHRARLCAECHVGTPDKEVNHDLIAAGHPRLNFDLGAYLGIYNKHWSHADELARYPDFEARAWALGQVASAQAALKLLASRAEGASAGGEHARPWPEFSEYDCFACHKDLTVSNVDRKAPRPRAGYPGGLPWQTWYLSDVLPLTREYAGGMPPADEALASLRKRMARPSPDPRRVGDEAADLARTMDGWLTRLESARPAGPERMRDLMARLAGDARRRADALDWDEAAQVYLGLAAVHQGLTDLGPGAVPPGVRGELAAVRRELHGAFPPGYDSPKDFRPLTADKLLAPLTRLNDQLGNR
jgi:hypothetical protein